MGAEGKRAIIFGSMSCGDGAFLRPYLEDGEWVVICADGGIRSARDAGLRPDYQIGDWDSGGAPEPGVPCVTLPVEKDMTDLQAAAEQALGMGCRELLLCGCTGGRLDHALANLQLLETARADGVEAILLDPDNRVTCIGPGEYVLLRTEYFYFSLLPIDAVLRGVTIEGAKYPLRDAEARRGDSLTISNEWIEPTVRLRIREGLCWLICSGAAAR